MLGARHIASLSISFRSIACVYLGNISEKPYHVHLLHTQPIFFKKSFKGLTKDDTVTTKSRNQRLHENNDSDKMPNTDPSLSFASLTITVNVSSATPQKSPTKTNAPKCGAFEGPATLTNADFTRGNQSAFQKPSVNFNGTSASQDVHGQYTPPTSPSTVPYMSFVEDMPREVPSYGLPTINQLVEISPFYLAGCDRLLIGVSATVAQRLGLMDGSGYYLVVELFPRICRPFIDEDFKHSASPPEIRSWKQHIRLAIDEAKVCLQRQTGPHIRQWYAFYSLVKMFGSLVQYCPHGEGRTCRNKQDVFGTLCQLGTSYEDFQDGRSLVVSIRIRNFSGTDFVKNIVWTGSFHDRGLLRLQDDVSFS